MYESEMIKNIQRYAEVEFAVFKAKELLKTKEEIFDDNYKIRFFTEIHEYLTFPSENTLQNYERRELELIEAASTSFISLLYDYYLKDECAFIESWDRIEDMIMTYCDRYSG